ncbi:MAG: Stk1 family PASTA domain-containing Ser/Thr kinase [Micrococcales bacterium]|nr:Stk1 family PASTA domain-containing Ser/Thr kinase [Micrococcales bacterium]
MDQRSILAGRYELGETIGRGGMAEVHIGHDRRLGRTVAVKVLRSDLARDPAFLNRFRREAQAAAALNHPAIVAVYDTGEEQVVEPGGGTAHMPYIVMEYVEGHTVREVLRDGRPLPPDEAIDIVGGVLSALEYSHRAGIVHRDIKPANVMLTTTGQVKVMDFGIARAVADSQATVTQASAVVGTAQYLSPEQARGEQVDARSDLYSTGCLLFELLTGRPPFVADSMVAVAYQHVREEPPRPSTLNPTLSPALGDTLDRIVHKSLAKGRETRYQTAAEFRADLEALMRGGRVSAPPVGAAAATAMMAPAQAATTVMDPMRPDLAREVSSAPARPGASPWQATGIMPEPEAAAEEEEPQRRWWIWALVALGVVAVALAVFLLTQGGGDKEMGTVPGVVGLPADEAASKIREAGFEPDPQEVAHDTVPVENVISQEPTEGAKLEKGKKVSYKVSTGPAAPGSGIEVPDVSGKTVGEAISELEAVGLEVERSTTTVDDGRFAKDRVVKTDPAEGTKVDEGTKVTLFVSTGRVKIPDLKGQSQEEAEAALNDLNLNSTVTTQESTQAAGTVVSTNPTAGTVVDQRSRVTLVIAIEATPTDLAVPSGLTGSYDAVVARLQDAGFTGTMTRRDLPSESVPAGQVISVTPASGQRVPVGQTFTITVSTGKQDPGDGPG